MIWCVRFKDALSQEMPVKLSKAISWLVRGLQQVLFPELEDWWQSPLTDKQQQLISILELVQIEKFVLHSASTQWLGRKLLDRQAIARSFVAKAVNGYPHTRALIEALKTTPNLRRICGFMRASDIPDESTFSRAFKEFSDTKCSLAQIR